MAVLSKHRVFGSLHRGCNGVHRHDQTEQVEQDVAHAGWVVGLIGVPAAVFGRAFEGCGISGGLPGFGAPDFDELLQVGVGAKQAPGRGVDRYPLVEPGVVMVGIVEDVEEKAEDAGGLGHGEETAGAGGVHLKVDGLQRVAHSLDVGRAKRGKQKGDLVGVLDAPLIEEGTHEAGCLGSDSGWFVGGPPDDRNGRAVPCSANDADKTEGWPE